MATDLFYRAAPPTPAPTMCTGAMSGVAILRSPATGERYATECRGDFGGGWTRYLQLTQDCAYPNNLDAVSMPTEMVNTCGGNEYTFSRAAMVAVGGAGQIMYRQRASPYKTVVIDFSRNSACTGDDFFKIVTSDYSTDKCIPWYLKPDGTWVKGCNGMCNDNEHTQFNCVADNSACSSSSGTSGVRFHYGTRDHLGSGEQCGPDGAYGCWTGWTDGSGTDTSMVWNWDTASGKVATDLFYRAAPSSDR